MFQDTRIALFLLAELVAALQANDPDTFKRWLYGGIPDLGRLWETRAIHATIVLRSQTWLRLMGGKQFGFSDYKLTNINK